MTYKVNKSISAKENLYALIQYTWPEHADLLNEDNVSAIVEPSITPGVLSVTLSPSESAIEVIGVKTVTYNVVDLTLIDTSDFISDPENLLGGVDAYIETLPCVPSEITVSTINEDEENGWSISLSAIDNALTVKGSVTLDLNVGGGGTGPGDGDGEGDGSGGDDGSGGTDPGDGSGGDDGSGDGGDPGFGEHLILHRRGPVLLNAPIGSILYSIDEKETWRENTTADFTVTLPFGGDTTVYFKSNDDVLLTRALTVKDHSYNTGNFIGIESWWESSRPIRLNVSNNPFYVPNSAPPNVTDMTRMFFGSSSFNSDISNWDVSNVTIMEHMFSSNSAFNQDLSNWNTSSVTIMTAMFYAASAFNSDISNWDVSSVTLMNNMFNSASSFNQDLSNWDVSNVTNMNQMFTRASVFNGDISQWDVSSVTNMGIMFQSASAFNSDISSWDVSNVTLMNQMFYEASSFNQDLSSWCVSRITSKPINFDRSTTAWTLPQPIWGTCPPR